jgi:hypothetical protein
VAVRLSLIPPSAEIEIIHEITCGGRPSVFRADVLDQVCGVLVERELGKVGRGEWQLYHLCRY